MNNIYIVLFISGIVYKILDEIYDSNVLTYYKEIFEFITLCLTMYIYTCNKYISLSYSIMYILFRCFSPSVVFEDFVWDIITYSSIIVLFFHVYNYKNLYLVHSTKDIKILLYTMIPLYISSSVLSSIESYTIPENYSYRKLIQRCYLLFFCIIVLCILNYNKYSINPDVLLVYNAIFILSLGYCICSVLFIMYYID